MNDKIGIIIKKCELGGIRYKYLECWLEYTKIKDDLILYNSLCCNKN